MSEFCMAGEETDNRAKMERLINRNRKLVRKAMVIRTCFLYAILVCAGLIAILLISNDRHDHEMENMQYQIDTLTSYATEIKTASNETIPELRSMELSIMDKMKDISELNQSVKSNIALIENTAVLSSELVNDLKLGTVLAERFSEVDELSIGDVQFIIDVFSENFPDVNIESIQTTYNQILQDDQTMHDSIKEYNALVSDYNNRVERLQEEIRFVGYQTVEFEYIDE